MSSSLVRKGETDPSLNMSNTNICVAAHPMTQVTRQCTMPMLAMPEQNWDFSSNKVDSQCSVPPF